MKLTPICPPDLSIRPFQLTVERLIPLICDVICRAWTEQLDHWFVAPGSVLMKAEVNGVFYFETQFEETRHPHYGRFLRLEPNKHIEITWLNADGSRGTETVVTVELSPYDQGTKLRLTHAGFTMRS